MKKIIFLVIIAVIFFTGCEPVDLYNPKIKQMEKVEWYGLFNSEIKRDDVIYQISPEVVIVGALFIKTVAIPTYVIGWGLYEPVRFIENNKGGRK